MARTSKKPIQNNSFASRDDVVRLLGPLNDEDVVAVLDLSPTFVEIEEASAWLDGQGDREAHRRPQAPQVAKILEIVDREDDEPRYLR